MAINIQRSWTRWLERKRTTVIKKKKVYMCQKILRIRYLRILEASLDSEGVLLGPLYITLSSVFVFPYLTSTCDLIGWKVQLKALDVTWNFGNSTQVAALFIHIFFLMTCKTYGIAHDQKKKKKKVWKHLHWDLPTEGNPVQYRNSVQVKKKFNHA